MEISADLIVQFVLFMVFGGGGLVAIRISQAKSMARFDSFEKMMEGALKEMKRDVAKHGEQISDHHARIAVIEKHSVCHYKKED